MQHLADLENGLAKCSGVLTEEQYKTAKKYGFQDKTIKRLAQVDKLPVVVFGSGPIRIGQGIEFDYCSVHCVWTLKKARL